MSPSATSTKSIESHCSHVTLAHLKSTIIEFRAGILRIVPRLVFNLQAYLLQSDGLQMQKVFLQTFPDTETSTDPVDNFLVESIDLQRSSFLSIATGPTAQIPSDSVLLNAMKISLLEAVR